MRKIIYLSSVFALFANVGLCQELKQTVIKGAPRLTNPVLLKAGDGFVCTEKAGHSAPALYDWNGDGKLDLLVGEFASGKGSNILVYMNNGTNKKPVYSSEKIYAKDTQGEKLYIHGS